MPETIVIETPSFLVGCFIVLDMVLMYSFKSFGDDYVEWWQALLVAAVVAVGQTAVVAGAANFVDWALAAIVVGGATYFIFGKAAESRWKKARIKKHDADSARRELERNETHEERVARLIEEDDRQRIQRRF